MTERVYAGLLERAEPLLASGRVAILDASFAAARHRDAARAFAAERGARAWLVEVSCPDAMALERLAERARAGRDPSDAGPEFLATSRARHEPPAEWPAASRLALDTGRRDWRERAAALARDVLRPAPRGS
jgi:predicted kinase